MPRRCHIECSITTLVTGGFIINEVPLLDSVFPQSNVLPQEIKEEFIKREQYLAPLPV